MHLVDGVLVARHAFLHRRYLRLQTHQLLQLLSGVAGSRGIGPDGAAKQALRDTLEQLGSNRGIQLALHLKLGDHGSLLAEFVAEHGNQLVPFNIGLPPLFLGCLEEGGELSWDDVGGG